MINEQWELEDELVHYKCVNLTLIVLVKQQSGFQPCHCVRWQTKINNG